MSKHNDGGPAFPAQPIQHFPDGSAIVQEQGGMTLRDYFAAKAMPSLLQNALDNEVTFDGYDSFDGMLAEHAYGLADAMLAARGVA